MVLPRMKLSDRITWAVLCWIFFNLLWLRFLEKALPQGVGALFATIGAVAMVWFWPRPLDQGEEEEAVPADGQAEGIAGERRE
ncbi:MAG TPA: hypothetical protein VFG53_15010 [Anaeromyxobacter sp.]|nr:hypothetical protein [Anaeromyxobacter sp.]